MSRLVRSAFAIPILVAMLGCQQIRSSTSPKQIRHVVDELYAAWTLHDPERVDAIFTDDPTYEDVAGGHVLRSKAEIKQLVRSPSAWAPDFRVTMTSLTIAGDVAMTEWVIEGTQTGEVPAGPYGMLPATGRAFRLRGASTLAFRDGRIARVTDYYDMATYLRQLGVNIAVSRQ